MIDAWKRRMAMRWLKRYLAGELVDDNNVGASNFGFDSRYPGVWFDFSAHTCPPNHRHTSLT